MAEEEVEWELVEDKPEILSIEDKAKLELFKTTYNARYVRNLLNNQKEYIYERVNPTLKKLLINSTLQLSLPDYLEGPSHFYKIIKEEEENHPVKTFYLFGETHIPEKTIACTRYKGTNLSFPEYIKLLSQFSPAFFDLYIELPRINEKYITENRRVEKKYTVSFPFSYSFHMINSVIDYLTDKIENRERIQNNISELVKIFALIDETGFRYNSNIVTEINRLFLNCTQPSLRNSNECELFRIHNIDMRHGFNYKNVQMTDYFNICIRIILLRKNINTKLLLFHYTNSIQFLKDLIKYDCLCFDNYFNIIKTNKNIKNEMDKSYMINNIIPFIQYEFYQIIRGQESAIISNIKTIINETSYLEQFDFPNDMQDTMFLSIFTEDFAKIFSELGVLMVDFYTLCRIFKYYDTSRPKQYEEELRSSRTYSTKRKYKYNNLCWK